MAKKIARGTMGQATVFSLNTQQGNPCISSPEVCETFWPTWKVSPEVNIGPRGADAANVTFGWLVTESGMITVPENASIGTHIAHYTTYEGPHPITSPDMGQTTERRFDFDVVCLTAEISATEITQAAGGVRHQCRAIVTGSTGPYQYTWSAQGGTIVTGQGTSVAVVDFPPNTAGSVSLSVNDPSCSATDSIPIAASPLAFTMTRPTGSGTGDKTGIRDQMHFTVVVEAVANGAIANPPSTISFQLRRSTGEVAQLTGELVAGVNPPTYRGFWNVTKAKGRWDIQVESPHRSNSVNFKIDKRGQIVQLARHWAGQGLNSCNYLPSFNACDGFVGYIYQSLGITAPSLIGGPNLSEVKTDNGQGAILFFAPYDSGTTSALHVGIVDGGERIDNNYTNDCENNPPTVRNADEGVGDWYDPPFVGSPKDPSDPNGLILDQD